MTDKNIQSDKPQKSSRRRYIIIAGLFVLLIMTASIFIVFSQNQKPDPASEAIIRQLVSRDLYYKTRGIDPRKSSLDLFRKAELAIDPNKLTDEDFLKIERLSLGDPFPSYDQLNSNMELCDIKLLKKFTNLKSLNIGFAHYPPNKIPKWMSLLAKLDIFNLEERLALDLSPLKKLNNLETLTIQDTNVKNLKALENLTNIQKLSLGDMPLSNLEYIRKYANLKYLNIYNTQVSDLEPLRELKNLKELRTQNTPVSNLEPLTKLQNLKELNLTKTKVCDIEPLKKLKNLKSLNLTDCPNITDEQVEDLQKALPELKIIR